MAPRIRCVPCFDGEMRLVAEETPLPAPGEAGVRVPLRDLALIYRRPLDVGLNQARIEQRAGLDEQPLGGQLPVEPGEQPLGQIRRHQRQPEAADCLRIGRFVSSANLQNRRNSSPSDSASSRPTSDSEYQRCSNSAFRIESGGYEGRPQTPDRTGLTNAANGAPSIIRSIRSSRRFEPTSGRRNATTKLG